VTDDVFRVAFVAFNSRDIVKFLGSLLTTLTCSNCDRFHIGSIGPFLSPDDIPFIVYANNLGLIRYRVFWEISVIETRKVNGILDPCRPNRLSVGLRRTGINNQIFHLNPRLSYDSSEEPPLLRFEGGSAKSDFAQYGYGLQLYAVIPPLALRSTGHWFSMFGRPASAAGIGD
jgi:hypothetical protein